MIDAEKRLYFASWLVSKFINVFKKPRTLDFKRILIVRLDEIGDMATTLPVFEALHERYPDAEITLWCKNFVAPLVQNCPYIHHIVHQKTELSGYYPLILELRGTWQSLFFALLHRPKIRLDRGSVRLKNKFSKAKHPHEVHTNLQVIEPILLSPPLSPNTTIFTARRNEQNAQLFLQRHNIAKFALLHTGARKKLRRWSPANFAEIAVYLKDARGLEIIFVGDDSEAMAIQKIQSLIYFETYNFAGQGTLMDYVALAKKATLMLGNESGPAHLAAAVNTPTITLFGPGEPHIFAPYGTQTVFLHHELPCNPCNQIDCIMPKNPCINHITVQEVIEKIRLLLDN